jgi:hypothetical protein
MFFERGITAAMHCEVLLIDTGYVHIHSHNMHSLHATYTNRAENKGSFTESNWRLHTKPNRQYWTQSLHFAPTTRARMRPTGRQHIKVLCSRTPNLTNPSRLPKHKSIQEKIWSRFLSMIYDKRIRYKAGIYSERCIKKNNQSTAKQQLKPQWAKVESRSARTLFTNAHDILVLQL